MLGSGRAPSSSSSSSSSWAALLGCLLSAAGSLGGFCALSASSPSSSSFEASDGAHLLRASPAGRALLGCRLTPLTPPEGAAFLRRCRALLRGDHPGVPGPFRSLDEARAACLDGPPRATRAKRGFTYPGTLWCGAGNIAGGYQELGEHRETDRCCREHDHCPHVIHPFTYKYGYRNLRWHTISHCDCDNRLKACLRAVNDTASRVVGQAFFNVIQVPCFQFTYKEQCVEPYLYVWCKNYSTVVVAVAQEPVLYEYGGEVIDGPSVHRPSVTAAPGGHGHLPASSAAPPHKPDKPVVAITDPPALPGRPGSSGKKHREGKGRKRKGKKGKGLKKKKKMEAKAEGPPVPLGDLATVSPKRLAVQELGKMGLQSPDLGEGDPFNAILGDDPGGGAGLRFGPDGARVERKEPVPSSPVPGASSTTRPPSRKKRKERRRPPGMKKETPPPPPHSAPS